MYLSWPAVEPAPLVKYYAIYQSDTAFTVTTGLVPRLTTTVTNAALAGLENDTPYHFAVTTVNHSDGFDTNVTSVMGIPRPDTQGPTVTTLTFDGQPLTNGLPVAYPGDLRVWATDLAGVSRAVFKVDDETVGTDVSGTPGYSAFVDRAHV